MATGMGTDSLIVTEAVGREAVAVIGPDNSSHSWMKDTLEVI